MWNLILTACSSIGFADVFQISEKNLPKQITKTHYVSQVNSQPYSGKFAQAPNSVEAASPLGYSLKYPSSWQRFTTQYSNPEVDIFIVKALSNSNNEALVTVTTTVRDFLEVPKDLPPTVSKFEKVAEFYAGIMSRSGYKIYEIKPLMINQRKAVVIVTEMPNKKGSITVLLEGKGEKMVVSTAIYPLDESIINRQTIEQVIGEIGEIQNSITIR
jgi:hypothetical protein